MDQIALNYNKAYRVLSFFNEKSFIFNIKLQYSFVSFHIDCHRFKCTSNWISVVETWDWRPLSCPSDITHKGRPALGGINYLTAGQPDETPIEAGVALAIVRWVTQETQYERQKQLENHRIEYGSVGPN